MSPARSFFPSPLAPWQAAHCAAYSDLPRSGFGVSFMSMGQAFSICTLAPCGTSWANHFM